jgi:hypothetical protein
MATTASAVINTTDTASGTPTVPDASVTTKWQEYIWVRHLEATNTNKAKAYVWNPNATSATTYLKWQEVAAAGAFSDLTGSATIAQLPTGITVSNLSIDGAITNTHLAGAITNANLAGSIVYSKITSVDAASVTSVSNSKIPVNTIPTGLTNTNIDTILGSASVDYDKLNIDDDTIPGLKIKDGLVHGQISSVSATTITTGTLPPARLAYMFERNLPIDSVANATGTYNLHTELGTASATFEGLRRVVASASSNEVIIALPNPALSAYVGKAAKLSIYRGSSTGKVTIKVCNSGTDSSAFATNKIVDNNNGEITDQVIVLPQLGTAAARKVVVDLLCDSKATGTDNGDGQWIITGGASFTGKGKVSVAGFRTGGGIDAAPDEGAQVDGGIGINKAPADGSGETNSFGTNAGDIPEAINAEVDTIESVPTTELGAGYTAPNGDILTVDDGSNWTTEAEFDTYTIASFGASDSPTGAARTNCITRILLDAGNRGVYTGGANKDTGAGQVSFEITSKLAATNTTTPSITYHAKFTITLRGIQPLGTDGNALSEGDAWKDPWTGKKRYAP